MSAVHDLNANYAEVRKRLGVPITPPIACILRPIAKAAPVKRDILVVATESLPALTNGLPPCSDEIRRIIGEVLAKHNMRWRWVVSRRRSAELVDCRQEIATRLRDETKVSVSRIATIMDRDHTSILNLFHRAKGHIIHDIPRDTILAIRDADGTWAEIGKTYGVSEWVVRAIRSRRRWEYVR